VGEVERVETAVQSPTRKPSHNIGLIFCAPFVHEDCRKHGEIADQQGNGEDALFCTLCNAELLYCKK
jgi:palmitoyltransferase